jgi:uncharacterized CHY-type Zn-finger protein
MRTIYLYLGDDFKDFRQDWSEVPVFKTLQVEDNLDLWNSAIKLDRKFYSIGCSQANTYYKIYKLKTANFDKNKESLETFNESEITCPICGHEIGDSWEYLDDSGVEICEECGAKLEWSRMVEVTYSTSVKEVAKPIDLD